MWLTAAETLPPLCSQVCQVFSLQRSAVTAFFFPPPAQPERPLSLKGTSFGDETARLTGEGGAADDVCLAFSTAREYKSK